MPRVCLASYEVFDLRDWSSVDFAWSFERPVPFVSRRAVELAIQPFGLEFSDLHCYCCMLFLFGGAELSKTLLLLMTRLTLYFPIVVGLFMLLVNTILCCRI